MRLYLICFCLVTLFAPSVSAESTITHYRDGALIHQSATAVKGTIDIPLAADLLEQTLTVIPAPGTTIHSVETRKTDPGISTDKEFDALTEQRRRLEDRLQALETREAIFTAAAKSQSGKAPRKTKGNPDPMQTIRQGTDFAIAQLEAVYTAHRRTNQELQKIDARLIATRKRGRTTENTVRVTVTPPRGSVSVRYAIQERGWRPEYSLHLSGDGFARLQLAARITGNVRGFQSRVSSGSLAESASAETFSAQPDMVTVLANYRLPITEEHPAAGIFNRFSGMITNNNPQYLPPGESTLFRNGAYLGKFRFEGLSSGRSRGISLGR